MGRLAAIARVLDATRSLLVLPVALLAGAVTMKLGVDALRIERGLAADGATATATVVAVAATRTSCRVSYRFVSRDGARHESTDDASRDACDLWKPGSLIPVLYVATNPALSTLSPSAQGRRAATWLSVGIAVLAGLAIWLAVALRRWRRAPLRG